MSFHTILVPHDFSDSAQHATAVARDEAIAHNARLVLLHVIELPLALLPSTARIHDATGVPISVEDYAFRTAETQLAEIASTLAHEGAKAEVSVLTGNPAEEIVHYADDHHVDLIVMGRHGRRGVRRWFAGSTTEHVLRTATAPVLAVRAG